MLGIPIRLIFYGLLFALLVGTVLGLRQAWNAHCGSTCAEKMATVTHERDQYLRDYNSYRDSQQRYNSETATKLAALQHDAELAAQERDDARQQRFTEVARLLGQIRERDARIGVSADTVRVLNRAIAAANLATVPARSAAAPEVAPAAAAADTTLAVVDGWVVTAARLYGECAGQVQDLIDFYQGVRASINRGPTPLPDRDGLLQPSHPPAS